jgi:probable phosphoglycerate mutase
VTIYLIRHGLAEAGVDNLDPGLAETGHKQAALAAEYLRDSTAMRLIVSPLRRTQETAAPIALQLSLEPDIREEVAEVFDPTMPADERRSMIGPFMAGRWCEQPRHLRDWRQRVVETLFEAAKANASHDLIVVSHYIAIGVALGEAMSDDRVVPIPMANASISSFSLGPSGLTLMEACSTKHLPAELITGVGQAMAGRQPG